MYLKAMAAGNAGYITPSYGMEAIFEPIELLITPEPVFTPVIYSFESYDSTGETKYATGTVETTETVADGKTMVKVLTNVAEPGIEGTESWIGLYFFVDSNALVNSDNLYTLYDVNKEDTRVKVKIASV